MRRGLCKHTNTYATRSPVRSPQSTVHRQSHPVFKQEEEHERHRGDDAHKDDRVEQRAAELLAGGVAGLLFGVCAWVDSLRVCLWQQMQ